MKFVWNLLKVFGLCVYLAGISAMFYGAALYIEGNVREGMYIVFLAAAIVTFEVQMMVAGLTHRPDMELVFFMLSTLGLGGGMLLLATLNGWLLQLAGHHVGAALLIAACGLAIGAAARWWLLRNDRQAVNS